MNIFRRVIIRIANAKPMPAANPDAARVCCNRFPCDRASCAIATAQVAQSTARLNSNRKRGPAFPPPYEPRPPARRSDPDRATWRTCGECRSGKGNTRACSRASVAAGARGGGRAAHTGAARARDQRTAIVKRAPIRDPFRCSEHNNILFAFSHTEIRRPAEQPERCGDDACVSPWCCSRRAPPSRCSSW